MIRFGGVAIHYQDNILYLEKDNLNGTANGFDSELFNQKVSCISLAYGDGVFSILFMDRGGGYFSLEWMLKYKAGQH